MDERVQFILKYQTDHLDKNISLKQASIMVNLSYGYVSGLFRKNVGMGFSQYLKQTRMEKAQKLLRESFKTIKEISFMTGYRHISSFCEEFKKMVGVSPSVYRRMDRIDDDFNRK
jgi:two-component system response regulator YesN